jgi:hypothetical protein
MSLMSIRAKNGRIVPTEMPRPGVAAHVEPAEQSAGGVNHIKRCAAEHGAGSAGAPSQPL